MGNKVAHKKIISLSDVAAGEKLANHLQQLIHRQEGYSYRPVVALCIGSDRYTGDSLGPLVGSYLLEYTGANVYGCLDQPVHAGNLVETVRLVGQSHYRPLILAVDACLGRTNEIGNIEIWEGGIEAGIAVGNRLPCVGDISIVGVVNAGGQMGYLDLQSTPLSIVVKLSRVIGAAAAEVLRKISGQSAAAVSTGNQW